MNIKNMIARFAGHISPRLFFNIAYYHNRKCLPRLSQPRDISEILIKRVLDGEVAKSYFLADKYLVRDVIKSKGYGNLLARLLGVYETPEEIDFDSLPDRFAIKMNYGAGMNIICADKSKLDITRTITQLNKWLLSKSLYSYSEAHYNLIKRRIIIEEFIDDGNGGFPTDYKFMCVYGRVQCILACTGRDKDHTFYTPFNLDWVRIPEYDRRIHSEMIDIPRPANLDEMIHIAESLSCNMPFVRVDLYTDGSRIWFGEYTLTPSGCILHGWTRQALDDMGNTYLKMEEALSQKQ